MDKLSKTSKNLVFIISILLISLTLFTNFYGNADIYDYANVAKFFSGDLNSKIRTSHSYLYGFIHTPLVDLTDSFFVFKFTNLIFLFMLIYSTFIISNRNKKVLWIMLISPAIWHMSPWISPIILSSLSFIWAYHFMKKYDIHSNTKELFYSGLLIGLSWALWDGVIFFIPLFAISFLYNKKLNKTVYFFIFIFIGILPRLILDQVLFGFAFYGIIRHLMATLTLLLFGGFYNQTVIFDKVFSIVLTLLFIPLYSYAIFRKKIFKKIFKEDKKTLIFLITSSIVIILSFQLRFIILVFPILVILLAKNLNSKNFKVQITILLIITILVINPYILQIKYSLGTNPFQGHDVGTLIQNKEIDFQKEFSKNLISSDLVNIGKEYPNQIFVVGNKDDAYAGFASTYWGQDIKELVSIQDYRIYLAGDPIIFKKDLCTNVRISERRDFCSSVWIRNSFNDKTKYEEIDYALTTEDDLILEGFEFIKKYELISLYKKL